MIHRIHRLTALLLTVLGVGLFAGMEWAQSAAPSNPSSVPATKGEPAKADTQPPGASSSEIPSIDPDVKQWFLERMRVRRPYDPRDIDVLTGRTREGDRLADFQMNGLGYWPPLSIGFGNSSWGPGRSRFRSPFASSSFLLFGNRRNAFSLGNSFGFGGGGFFFGRPFFQPFAFQRHNFRR
ncbi:MAG: hypothetical protein LAO21_12685 [Acidobacteriia bacterium]|nr:hypothetical protein [Terriglobia bacterium]